jgi:hypothetical protein
MDAARPDSVVTTASGAVPTPLGEAAPASVPITPAASAASVGSTDATDCSGVGEAVAAGEAGADAVVEDEAAVEGETLPEVGGRYLGRLGIG